MSFEDDIDDIAKRSKQGGELAETEEATKLAIIVPFIRALGYDVFDLSQVVPEFCADVGLKKGEKVDFALKIDGKVAVLIEVKPYSMNLGSAQYSQLFRYFSVTEARVAILTNGREVWFFSDIDASNKMDKAPFFKFNFDAYDNAQVESLKKFHRSNFAVEAILSEANLLRYCDLVANYLRRQISEPDEEFVKFIGRQVYDGSVTKNVVEQLTPAIQSALDSIVRSEISEKLNVAFPVQQKAEVTPISENDDNVSTEPESGIITTEDELQAFMIIRAICAEISDVENIVLRDAKSYCAVIFGDVNRKPICRFWFNSKSVKYIGLFDENKNETKQKIDSLSDIYKFSKQLRETVSRYL